MGIIRECGGKMDMTERRWAEAATVIFFNNYIFDLRLSNASFTGQFPVSLLWMDIWEASFSCPSWFSSGARNLIKRILDPSPLTRITIPEILQDEWFKKRYKRPKFEQDEDLLENSEQGNLVALAAINEVCYHIPLGETQKLTRGNFVVPEQAVEERVQRQIEPSLECVKGSRKLSSMVTLSL
ncbi:hypothetical protein PVK06_011427 [Gossypium arboreum]|uniref:Uncharacterized protein n=1 Tax=Gossypium arboreum TaxID=29729 RepID=A0ABR0Q938_GOSAR|nr:hypothetical protein PVK06_011427 [Gossypium arboreum]